MLRFTALAVAAVLVLAGCSSPNPTASPSAGEGRLNDITVTVGNSRAPALIWPSGLDFTKAESQVLWPGDGDQLVDGQHLLVDVYIQSLETGDVLKNTYDGLPESFLLAPELLGDDLYQQLRSQRVGTRIVAVSPPDGVLDEIAIVMDVLPNRATGTAVNVRNDVPIVFNGPTGEPEITFREGQELPRELTVATLIRGSGEQVQPGSYVLAQYKAVYTEAGADAEGEWVPGGIFDSTWAPAREPYTVEIGAGETIRAIDEGLIDQTAGSQVLIVAPASAAYPGKGTLVFVVDILDVWTPET